MPFTLQDISREPTFKLSYCTDGSFKRMHVDRPIELNWLGVLV